MAHSIFAMELCMRLDGRAELHHHLRQTLPDVTQMAVGHKWQCYHRATQILAYNLQSAERGCWDYFDDPERAQNDFEMWKNGMVTAEGARPGPRPLSPAEPRYLTFTMAFLLVKDSPSDLALRRLCEISQEHLWERRVFAHLLNSFGKVSFASVFRDVSYIIPRDIEWALTREDLAHEKFQYLRMLRG